MAASVSVAQAVCDQTINSTSGATISFNSVNQVYRLCLTVVSTANTGDDAVVYGLYSVSGTNAAVVFPIAGNSASAFSDYNATTGKASYTLHPSSANDNGQNANTGNAQIDIKLNSQTGGGQEQITLYYAADCSDRLAACSGAGSATTPWILTINLPGPTATQNVASKALTVNTATASFTPVVGSGGTAPLGYGINPTLPAGLSFNTSTGAITGTPTVTSATATYTVTVTDFNNVSASSTFSLTVNGPVTATQAVASKTLTQNQPSTSFTPVTGGGGTPSLAYSVSPSLPSGLSLNGSTGTITGSPTAVSGATTYTVTVTDANSATASNTFTLAVNGTVTATQSVASATVATNVPITPFTPVTGSNGTPSLSYAVAPALPAGLVISSTTGQISGTPTTPKVTTTYTVTVTDANNAIASNTFQLTVNNGPLAANQSIASKTLTQNTAVASFTPVTGSGGVPALTYGILPSLPAGLSFNTSTGAISGTPTATSGVTTYTVTVTDANSATASNTFSLSVNGGVSATQAVASKIVNAGQPITAFTPVTGSGGTTPLTYAVSPALPAGLAINTSTGSISGTPTATIAATTFTVTVTDANSATATNTFSLTVNGALVAATAIPSSALPINQAVTPFIPVTGSGGTGSLTFAVSPGLPTGLGFNTSNGTISGTPTASSPTTTYTVTVTDGISATASANFSLSVGQLATTVTLTSSQNPSQFGQAVIFTATVAPQGGSGTPTGTVTFRDNGAVIGSATLASGTAALTITTLAVGSHTITASYGGAVVYAPSTSTGLAQTVDVPVDSVRLRSLQQTVSKLVAQNSGQAVSGAIDDAIADGFGDGGAFLTPGNGRMRFNFSADPRDEDERAPGTDRAGTAESVSSASALMPRASEPRGRGRGRVDDPFAAIDRRETKQPAAKWHEQKEWLLWADIRGTGVDRWGSTSSAGIAQANQASLYGQQLNATMGLTYRVSPSLVVGVLGGYETFNYTQQDISGKLKGDGWTAGAYLGWKIVPTLRFDAALAYSGIGYDGSAGQAQGQFTGQRLMASTGLTGNVKWAGLVLEPSAKIYALWEHQNAYTDSLGTRQESYDFASGRASGGLRGAYPIAWLDSGVVLTPFLGLYGDYYFNKDDAGAIAAGALASTPLLQGWSARATGGLGIQTPGGAGVGLGAELGGIGSNTRVWTLSARARVPFAPR